MSFERYNTMTVEELESEKRRLFGSIQNEKLWMFGSATMEEEIMHCHNINHLRVELGYVMERIYEVKGK